MEMCARCGITDNEIRIFDAIYDGRMSYLCERCSIIENIPIIKKPNIEQLKESEQRIKVHERMKTLSGMIKPKKEETFFKSDKLNELEENPKRELPEEDQLKLIEHYHWAIMKNRRRKGLSQKKLSELLGESEIAIQMIEKNKLPENPEKLITKLEQFFQIKLREITEIGGYLKEKDGQPILFDEEGMELEIIPEPNPVIIEPEPESTNLKSYEQSKEAERFKKIPEKKRDFKFEEEYYPIIKNKQREAINEEPSSEVKTSDITDNQIIKNQQSLGFDASSDFDIKKANLSNITISKLRTMHRRRVEATRQEQLEEQRKIEERQKILEALREKERLKKEQKRQQEKVEQQKSIEEKENLINERRQELQRVKKRESEDIDQYLGGSEFLDQDSDDSKKELDKQNSVEEFDKELI